MIKSRFLQKTLAVSSVCVMAFLMILAPVNSVMAAQSDDIDETTLYEFAQNGVYFYNPAQKKTDGQCGNIGGGNNQNYAGATIFSESQMDAIRNNMEFYQAAAEKYNFPWQILAIIHGLEHSYMRDNPANGQGAYQLYSYTRIPGTSDLDPSKAFLPAGPIDDDEFQRQTDIAASVVAGKASGLDLNTDDGVKTLFFRYNGVSSSYIEQAKNLGFTDEEASHGEGSPYVMNRYDEKRDPTVEPTRSNGTWGQIKTDLGGMEYPANSGFGAYVKYVALGGSAGDCNSGTLVSGGMTLEQARQFMQYYIDAAAQYEGRNVNAVLDGMTFTKYASCSSALNNCVAFSRWFLGKYTTVGTSVVGTDGGGMARLVANTYGLELTQTPRAYAIFSYLNPTPDNPNNGHTGVVLGVDEATGVMYTGEAACGVNYTLSDIKVKTRQISGHTGGKWYYAYTDTILKGDF